jgi:hypothetical protein
MNMPDVTLSPVSILARLQKKYSYELSKILTGARLTHHALRGTYNLVAGAVTPIGDKEGGTAVVLLIQNPEIVGSAQSKETYVLVRDWIIAPPIGSLETATLLLRARVMEELTKAQFTVLEKP